MPHLGDLEAGRVDEAVVRTKNLVGSDAMKPNPGGIALFMLIVSSEC